MIIYIYIYINIQANTLDKIVCALKLSWGTKAIGNSWQQHFLRVPWILSESCCQYRGGVSYLFFKYIYTFQYGATIVLTHKRKLSPSNCNDNEIHQMTEQMSHCYGRFSVICLVLEGNLQQQVFNREGSGISVPVHLLCPPPLKKLHRGNLIPNLKQTFSDTSLAYLKQVKYFPADHFSHLLLSAGRFVLLVYCNVHLTIYSLLCQE